MDGGKTTFLLGFGLFSGANMLVLGSVFINGIILEMILMLNLWREWKANLFL